MYAKVIGEVVDEMTVLQYQFSHVISLLWMVKCLQFVDLLCGKSEYLAEFTNHRPILECVVCPEQRGVLPAVPVKEVLGDGLPVPGTEVDIKVGWTVAAGIDESFEVQVQFQRIYICDADQEGHHAVCAASSSHMVVIVPACKAYQVPVDQEISAELELADYIKLFLHAGNDLRGDVRISVCNPFFTLLAKQSDVFGG